MMQKIFTFIILLALSQISAQNTYYVSENGNNNNNGLTQQAAFATLQHVADIVSAGDSVLVLSGNYAGFDLRTGGTQNSQIVFKANENNVIINQRNPVTNDGINVENADWVVVDGFNIINQPRAGIRIAVSDFVTIKNNICTSNSRWGIFTGFTNNIVIENNTCSFSGTEHGIYVSNSGDNPLVRNNICFENHGCGIQLNADVSQGGDGIITNAVIESNILHDNCYGGGSAINLDGVQNSNIYNNLLYNNHSTGIALFMIDGAEGSKNNKVFNNTIINPDDGRWNILVVDASTGNTLYNNILINHHSFRGSISIDPASMPGFVSDYNIVENRLSNDDGNSNMSLTQWQTLGYDLNSQITDPEELLFADHTNGNFHLLQSSQAVDNGTSIVSGIVSFGMDGETRPQGNGFDIGCYEYSLTAGITERNFPDGFKLCQNYPNPFNPSTTIKYSIPKVAFVSLKIYDVLGRKVANLINEEKPSGNYQIEWNAENFASGIYFFKIQAGDFAQTKKMVLLK